VLSLAALGVVYGDIGTSPLYAIRECFHGAYGIEPAPANVLGVLSLIVWSLMMVVTVKYLAFIMRADNDGEGGIIALLAQLKPDTKVRRRRREVLVALGLFGAALLYGDGMITPAISVLSAVEGLRVAAPGLDPYVIPVTVGLLAGLFLFQRQGTGGIGAVFGPVMLAWFLVLGALGIRGILQNPQVLTAVNPAHGVDFFLRNRLHGYLVLGAVFLVVTGAEALFADMGHFGRRPIRLAWYVLVLPSLLLSYFGQGALLLGNPQAAHHPFYSLVPAWAHFPMVALATSATIIASQAVISGAFSLTRQAIQLGFCPRLTIVHTSAEEEGQIYIPEVNWLLMVATISLVLGFRVTSKLAAAYGVAVTATMAVATVLFYVVARERWGWSRLAAGMLAVVFLAVDLAFLGANIGKITHGAWFPLAVGLAAYTLMATWKRGRQILARRFAAEARPLGEFLDEINADPPTRIAGRAVFMTGNLDIVPPALLENLKHNKVLHEEVVLLTVLATDVPHVPGRRRVKLVSLGNGFYQLTAHYGYMQSPNVPRVLARARKKGLQFGMADTSFFLGRERLLPRKDGGMPVWRASIFSFMSRNAQGATAYFGIPPSHVIELGGQVAL
jgi:KUP system potassium uptake protein